MDLYDMGPAMDVSASRHTAEKAKTSADDAKAEIEALKARVADLEQAVIHISKLLVL